MKVKEKFICQLQVRLSKIGQYCFKSAIIMTAYKEKSNLKMKSPFLMWNVYIMKIIYSKWNTLNFKGSNNTYNNTPKREFIFLQSSSNYEKKKKSKITNLFSNNSFWE